LTITVRAASQDVVLEGLIYENPQPTLFLLSPKEFHGDQTNIYAMTTGYVKKVAALCGFEWVDTQMRRYAATRLRRFFRRPHPRSNRAAMRFRRVSELTPDYRTSCFSVAPKALQR
jgi:hypothetical protein